MREIVDKSGGIRLVLKGGTDSELIPNKEETKYASNYELSQARVDSVKQRISEELARLYGGKWFYIEWVCMPLSSDVSAELNNSRSGWNLPEADSWKRAVVVTASPIFASPLDMQKKNHDEVFRRLRRYRMVLTMLQRRLGARLRSPVRMSRSLNL